MRTHLREFGSGQNGRSRLNPHVLYKDYATHAVCVVFDKFATAPPKGTRKTRSDSNCFLTHVKTMNSVKSNVSVLHRSPVHNQ